MTGAGDLFAAGFLHGYINNLTLRESLELGTDISNASDSDVIDDTVDYKAVSKTLKSFIGDSEFQLIEALAEESVKLIFEKFNVNYIKGRFSKPGAVTGSKEVGVIIERYRDNT